MFYLISPYEWILSNSLGGYALGSPSLLNSRKYHGLLIASGCDFRRVHLVSSIEERVEVAGKASFSLDNNNYPNVIYPQGYRQLVKYFLRPFPAFVYSTLPSSDKVLLLKTIKLHPKSNHCTVAYKNLGMLPAFLILRPKFTLRDHHSINHPGHWERAGYNIEVSDNVGKVGSGGLAAIVSSSKGGIVSEPIIYRNVIYATEAIRGYDAAEDLLAPFKITAMLDPGEQAVLVFGDKEANPESIIRETDARYSEYPLPWSHPATLKTEPRAVPIGISDAREAFDYKQYLRIVELALREFIANDDLVAGFPWFSAWGRDTMISMEALKYLDGGVELSYRIIKKYGDNMRDGIIPNTFGEGTAGRNYDTVDASLWYGIRALELRELCNPAERSLILEFVSRVVVNYIFNPSLPFHLDFKDGLIDIHRDTGLATTWMDAKIHGEPVTPRYGKPIEVNALWYNLLKSLIRLAGKEKIKRIQGDGRSITLSRLKSLASKSKKSLRMYFTDGSFADRRADGELIMETRPNYIIALSLPYDIFTIEEMEIGYLLAKGKLLTPYGLRSLSPDNRAFRGRYMGNQRMRDFAYHQGTVWPWLLLPMAKVAAKIYRRNRYSLTSELHALVAVFRDGVMRGEMASIPELYNGEDPLLPKGAPAQCWSVAAVFLIEKMLERMSNAI